MVIHNIEIPRSSAEVSIETTTLLPSGDVLMLTIMPTTDGRYLVSDDGAGVAEAYANGVGSISAGDRRRGTEIAGTFGLTFESDRFGIQDLRAVQIESAVIYVAEAVRLWCANVVEAMAQRRDNEMKQQLFARLGEVLPRTTLERDAELRGESTKLHRFDVVAVLTGTRRAVFDAVTPHPASLSATHMKFSDLGQAHPEWPREAVTARIAAWDQADLALLSAVATHVRDFETDWADLRALAA